MNLLIIFKNGEIRLEMDVIRVLLKLPYSYKRNEGHYNEKVVDWKESVEFDTTGYNHQYELCTILCCKLYPANDYETDFCVKLQERIDLKLKNPHNDICEYCGTKLEHIETEIESQ
jgi:hypothetical protein